MMSLTDIYKKNIILETPTTKRNQLFLKEFFNITLEYESLNPHGTLDDFIKYINLMSKFDIELSEGFESENAIQVTTIHQSKGREFPIVFIIDVAQGKLPLRYQSKIFYIPSELSKEYDKEEDEKELYIQEERRLFYVAMTRAQHLLYITFAKKYGQNIKETKPSKFLEEIKYQNNPLVEYYEYESNNANGASFQEVNEEFESEIEKLKSQLQHQEQKQFLKCN